MLYQLNQNEQQIVVEKAKLLLKQPEGILLVQDFARKNPKKPQSLDFSNSWFGDGFGYRTFLATCSNDWQFLEALQWNNGRCAVVRSGEDFDAIFTAPTKAGIQLRTSTAFLAHSTS